MTDILPIMIFRTSALLILAFTSAINLAFASSDGTHHHHQLSQDHLLNPPQLSLIATKDNISGWNVKVDTVNFKFTPERINQPHIDGQGHAHLYVNDKKLRVYTATGITLTRYRKVCIR